MHYAPGDRTKLPTAPDANNVQESIEAAQALFRRTLSNWVGDLLVLRQSGQLEMTWRDSGLEPEYRAAA